MRTFPIHRGRGLGVLLGVVATMTAHSQQSPAAEPSSPSVHRMVIVEGANRRVHYIGSDGLSTSDRLAAADLERTENELAYLSELQQLKHEYVRSEISLEPYRRYVQRQLYGTRIQYGGYNSTYANYVPNSGLGVPGTNGYNTFYGPFSRGYGYGGYGYPGVAYGSGMGSSYSVTQSLQYGVGDEGRFKNAIVSVIAQQASPEYAATALRNYEAALNRAAESSVLSRDLGLKKSDSPPPREKKK